MTSTLKTLCGVLVAVAPVIAVARGGDEVRLEPDATLRFEFPDLPDTLETMSTAKREPARLTAQLPANYSREGRFSLFLFLNGGGGGRGNSLPLDRKVVGSNDFICVNVPLFRRSIGDFKQDAGIVSGEDFEVASRAYRIMLQKLFDIVPNIIPERSALGGFSNGAHTTAVLLAGQDEFILHHFHAFYIVEGGFGPLAANVLPKVAMKQCRFLVLRGDQPDDDQPESRAEREHNTHLARALEYEAEKQHLDFTSVVMRGQGHDLPLKYQTLLGAWVRGEKLPDLEAR